MGQTFAPMIRLTPGVRYMLISTAGFSVMNLCVKGLGHIPALQIMFSRVAISMGLTLWGIRQAGVSPWGEQRLWLLIRGAAGALALWLYFVTIKHLPLSTAVAVQYMSPLFGAALAPWMIGEKMPARRWLYFLVSFAGVFALQRFEGHIEPLYLLFGILSALLTGLGTNAIRRSRETEHPLVVMFYLPLFAVPASAPYTLTHWVQPVGVEWLLLLATGIFTQINQYYTTKAIQAEPLARVTYLNYLGLIYAVVLGYLIFGEPVSLGGVGAMCLIAGGVLLNLVDGRWKGLRKG